MTGKRIATLLAAVALPVVGLTVSPTAAFARAEKVFTFHVPAGSLASALRAVATISGRNIAASAELLADRQSPALDGNFTAEGAVDHLLAGSGLHARAVGGGLIVEADAAGREDVSTTLPTDIVVTGSRIRGAKVASSVVTISREDARNQGQGSLGEIARSLPQSFGGGQNPGLGFNVPTSSGVNAGGGSSLNLRGLGSDATLTLLDGHRLAYGGSRQAIDISVVPLGALDRIEVVADGASALYGSDAVGGVANIVLRRDFEGVETRARLGASTDGGNFQQQYGLTAGLRWQGGGVLVAYEFNRTTAIDAADRDYSAVRSRGLTLRPATRSNSILLNGRQDLGGNVEFALDALYNRRSIAFVYAEDPTGNRAIARDESSTIETAFVVAPSLNWRLPNGGRVELAGSFGTDFVHYQDIDIIPPAAPHLTGGCYCNRMVAIELSGDTPLFRLPGGDAKVALGIGTRRTGLTTARIPSDPQDFVRNQSSVYAFSEFDLPLVGRDNAVPGIARLNLNAAIRYERYKGITSIATPKFGLIWAPIDGLELRGSWGKSFRAPTLQQRYQSFLVFLFPAARLGGTGYPSDATVLYAQGGNPALRPERATSWSLGAAFKPAVVPGLRLELNYFSTDYIDRIVAPIGFITQSLSSPLYAPQVNRTPSRSQIDAVRAAAGIFTVSGVSGYDPTKVVAIIDNSSVNAGRQPVHGIDALLRYSGKISERDTLTLDANASYLVSSRQISTTQPIIPLAGILFNPPSWRGRGSLSWQHDGVGLTSTINYMGDLRDTRTTPALRIPGQATVDLALRVRTGKDGGGALRGLEFILAAQNVFNIAPPPIVTGPITDTPYDSTNYSPIGRFVSFTIAKKW